MSGRTRSPSAGLAPEHCACGNMAAGYCAVRETPVCPVCAALLEGSADE